MTEEMNSPDQAPPGPNLAVLKGIVVGLGVLLCLGTLLIVVKMMALGKNDDAAAPMAIATGADLADLPTLDLASGDTVISVSAGDGLICVIIEGQDGVRRIVALDRRNPAGWTQLTAR
ncbi:hypothetical protein [Parvularcula sp. LCG005]|uniref:hypothetical protein n=1 Tax=Parvularcula sp. LCG005 TaxID=3078805 RepID=UPI002943958C|nr:hypothetical protein [Parvularcula sp. LCG005]WOI53926.1 hypothetical protein RUI03_02725 [Parvularcula sp. LCG005]